MNVRKQMKNRKGTDSFVASQRIATFNKLFGLSTASAYRQPDVPPTQSAEPKTPEPVGVTDLSGFSG